MAHGSCGKSSSEAFDHWIHSDEVVTLEEEGRSRGMTIKVEDAIANLQYQMLRFAKGTEPDLALKMAIEALKERKTDICENIGEDYAECDQFVCSKCGIELQDWHGVERDMDDEFREEVSYHEYTFRFCPNCGRRIEEGAEE